MADSIHQDLLILILKRLPVKTLLLCRCVSKSWNQLLHSKSFIQDHLAAQTRRMVVQTQDLWYLHFEPHNLPLFDTLRGPNRFIRVRRSDRGYAFSSVNGVNCVYNNANILVLFNPSTQQVLRIPLPKLPIFRSNTHFKHCGFWIDPSTNDFKVVVFSLDTQKSVLFSSKENEWVDVDMGEIRSLGSDHESPQVTIDGVGHWIARRDSENGARILVSFDFEQHKFGSIELPHLELLKWRCLRLCKWKDLLSFVHHYRILDHVVCDLWVMQNGSWGKMFSFNLPEDATGVYCVLGSSGRVLAEVYDDSLMLYDPVDGFTLLDEIGAFCFNLSYDFVESLVFPDQSRISSG